ncbi:histidine kinase [Tychonema sp. LEGE 07199]|uniref:HD domain-containing phosphohydrolase n=1 Tax=unclassified Tychonema TaxID=2642144 RepID=UPI00187F2C3E|nr:MULTISPECIES: HD domain-containing phosphohydrolase [unclassified Tychonema]MBE9124125.1 histidine kinase [Tychonema sp. LEGE 07199]MBE9134785.1 histidine kinase [Tychonema sp. LEGE 07196]
MNPESTLARLQATLPDGKLPSSYGVYFKNTLVALCHALEDHILQTSSGDELELKPLVLVTFQQGKWYLQEADRYLDIANASRRVVIGAVADSGFATHKTGQLENVSLINLDENDPIIEEWNLIILAPTYKAMVLCRELSSEEYLPEGKPEVDTERKFYGLWSFDQSLVSASAEIFIEQTRHYNSPLADSLQEIYRSILATKGPPLADISGVVSRIVTYLQSSQQQMVAINRQTRDLWELEGQALRVSRNLNANKLQAFLRMAQRVDERDTSNPTASLQVAALSETLGQLLDLPALQLRRLRLAGLLFRIGLVSAPNEVFDRTPDAFDQATFSFWRDRSFIGSQLLQAMPELAPVAEIVKHKLEYWDGSGRPEGLRGEEIPIAARILGLVAYFQELTQPRGDRSALSLSEALEECRQLCGIRFDPALVETLSNVVRLAEMGLMQLPNRPSQLPNVWLEESGDRTTAAAPAL